MNYILPIAVLLSIVLWL